jgi:peroxiredoxin
MAIPVGSTAPSFNLKGVDGHEHSLDSLGGKKAVAVIFSCNHCPYVLAWEDRMIAIQGDYEARGVALIVINSNNAETHPTDSFENMVTHSQEKSFNFPYVRDDSQEVATAYGATHTPEVFLLNAERTVAYHGAIDDNHEDADGAKAHYLRNALDAVLEGKSAPISETPPVGCTVKWK